MSVTELQPGPELDARVGERLMGFKWYEINTTWARGACYLAKKPSYRTCKEVKKPGRLLSDWDRFLKPYSTDIAAALEVVEKLKTNYRSPSWTGEVGSGWGFLLEHCTEASEEKWSAVFVKTTCAPPFENMNYDCHAEGDTPAEAICLAALKAAGID